MSHRAFSACTCKLCKASSNPNNLFAEIRRNRGRNGSSASSPSQTGTKKEKANASQPKPLKNANPDNSDKREMLCPICMMDIFELKNPVCPPCGHVICQVCMKQLTSARKEMFLCALCKEPYKKSQITKIYF